MSPQQIYIKNSFLSRFRVRFPNVDMTCFLATLVISIIFNSFISYYFVAIFLFAFSVKISSKIFISVLK